MTDSKIIPAGLRSWAQRPVGPITAVRDVDPGLRPAVLGGYGRGLSPEEEYALVRLAALDAVSCLAWAPAHGDHEVAARGRRTLDRLPAEVRA